jgi:hypothetical protein
MAVLVATTLKKEHERHLQTSCAFKPLDLTLLFFKNSRRAITVHCENGLVVDIFKALFFSWFVLIFSNAITEK